jgi:1-aminocyclopropane-1-carboxylate deaminase
MLPKLISIFDKRTAFSKTHTFYLNNDNNRNNKLFIKRDDLIHPDVSGNKWRKLKWNIVSAMNHDCELINTYGGAYSNHLLAVASIGNELGLKTRGNVRGDELTMDSNPLLRKCSDLKMELIFHSRKKFNELKYFDGIDSSDAQIWNIPEGGANREGVQGCYEIMGETENDYDYVILAQGTTTTSLGVYSSLNLKTKLLVVPVLRGFNAIKEMETLATQCMRPLDKNRVEALTDFHFGGYAKTDAKLDAFVKNFNERSNFSIEPIYTGKVMYALNEFIKLNDLRNQRILFIHTGGLSKY